ncbi:hypothetical protein C8F01DRAFT_1148938 [Mycena amicta]|nr:hypothetical protein C8F01DRAFT_1148938 [Mycena amicta]
MHLQVLLLCAVLLGLATPGWTVKTKAVVLFGDSYTDQSRQHSIANGTFPGKDYQEIFPPADTAADGGVQWPWYLGLYGNYTIWNYAVGGAVCSNVLTTVNAEPDVIGGQTDWFIQDHTSFVVIVYVGTNDVGLHSFVTDDESPTLQTLRNLYALGARRFIVNSMIPLQLTRLYSTSSDPTIYFLRPAQRDASMNALLRGGVLALRTEWAHSGATVQMFDTYGFFTEMYDNPTRFFNGSAPANVTGHCHQCPDPNDFTQVRSDCTLDQRDSYMWWDELHPSEQTGRNLAMETFKALNGRSKFLF